MCSIENCFLFEYILKYNLFLWGKAEFSASLLDHMILQKPFWPGAWETFLLLLITNNIIKNSY